MPSFDFPTLLWWGLPLAAAPLAIHLLSRLRHARVPFAALEFLLVSRRRHRLRVLLRQILLLALRTAAVLGLVAALAQPRWRSALGSLFGAGPTLHLVLLDDSGSMGDCSTPGGGGGESAFDRGRRAVERIATDLAGAAAPHELAVWRCSRLVAGTVADLPRQPVTARTVQDARSELAALAPSARATPPTAALAAAADLVASGSATAGVVWLVGDFRAKDWVAAPAAAPAVARLVDAGAAVRFVDCAVDGGDRGNLTLQRLEPVAGVPAVGGVVTLEVEVRNDGTQAGVDVPVSLREDGVDRPGVSLAAIPPGGTATGRFDAVFGAAGSHVVTATLPGDVLPADDARTAVVEIAEAVDVLLVDGDDRGGGRSGDAFYVAAALAPGGGAPTGLRPRIEPPRKLAELDLSRFDSIWLLDVPRLDRPEIERLESYARSGGGVVFFGGPRTDVAASNRLLWRDGAGLFPAPLAAAVDLPAAADGPAAQPDIRAEDHPVVAVLAGQRNPLLDAVAVERYLAIDRDAETPGLRRLVSLRNGAALAVERSYGEGLVVAVLTTAAPVWNTWARGNPSWVVVLLELEGHLARGRRREASLAVGDAIDVRLDPAADARDVEFVVPPAGTIVRRPAESAADGSVAARLAATDEPGGYLARWQRLDGAARERAFAVNVAPEEGRLERIGRERLVRELAGLPFTVDRADDLTAADAPLAGTSLARPLLAALVGVLLLEQFVARLAGYHHAPRSSDRSPVAAH